MRKTMSVKRRSWPRQVKGAITIATNMAGRGTDITLGGNAEYLAKAQMRKEHFCENLLNPERPEDTLPAQVEQLLIEADGHGDTQDANILAVRQRFEELYAQYKKQTDAEAAEVRQAGGLFIIGTERHESRRIDNQLRGRSGRQGDPGASRFYLSLEDDLMRLFGGDRVSGLMDTVDRRGYPHREPDDHQHHRKRPEEAGRPEVSRSAKTCCGTTM